MWIRWFLLVAALQSGLLAQQPLPIDTAKSNLTVHAYKTGLFSFAGHDHTISAPIASGTLDISARTIHFTVNTRDLKVLDPGESEKNRTEIHDTMLSNKLLDAQQFPTISFHSTSVEPVSADVFKVRGELTMHGVSRPLTLNVTRSAGQYAGTTHLKQTDFGLTPVSVAGGTVKVKDEVSVDFVVVTK